MGKVGWQRTLFIGVILLAALFFSSRDPSGEAIRSTPAAAPAPIFPAPSKHHSEPIPFTASSGALRLGEI